MAADLIPPFGRNDPCWCGSEGKYKACHGSGPSSTPGAPVRPDDEEGYWVSPTVRIARGAMRTSEAFGNAGVPITMQRENRPVAGPLIVPGYGAVMASTSSPSDLSLGEAGLRRFDILTEYGLDDEAALAEQLDVLSNDALTEVALELLKNGRTTLDLLGRSVVGEKALTALWTESSTVTSMIGQTLLWADLYLTEDPLLDAFLASEEPNRETLPQAISEALRLRPLVENGVVVPVPAGAAVVLAADTIQQSTNDDLKNGPLVEWVDRQLVVEGPTAREVVFVHARDDEEEGFFTHNRIQELGDDGTFKMAMLQPYDPNFDYEPWLRTVRNQFTARLTQQLNTDLAIAGLFGGEYVTRLPFRARFAYQRAPVTSAPAIAASIEVPWLPQLDASKLARIAGQDEAVDDLRRRVRRAISAVNDAPDAQNALSNLVAEIAEDAAGPLARKLARDRAWRLVVPGGAAVGTIILGATASPVGAAVGAALGLAAWAGPAFADYKEPRTIAPYVFWQAQRRSGNPRRK